MSTHAIHESAALVSEYAGSDASKAFIGLLDALIANYIAELEVVNTVDLVALQARLQQCRRLRDLLAGVPNTDPRV